MGSRSNLLPYTCSQLAGALENVKCGAQSSACLETVQFRKQF